MKWLETSIAQIAGKKRQLALSRWCEKQDARYRISMRRVRNFHDIHAGKRCFIIGNGPSLNQTDLSLLKNEITFGTNRIYMNFDKMGFETTYHVCVNELVVEQCADEIAALKMPKFIGWHARDLIDFTDSTTFLYTRGGLRSWFFTDLTEGCWEGSTVTMVALQTAFYMGFSEVYLVGVDHRYKFEGTPHAAVISTGTDPNHFNGNYFGKGFRWHLPDLEGSEMSYRVADFVNRQHGRQIYDATVGGALQIFSKVDFKSLFSTLDKGGGMNRKTVALVPMRHDSERVPGKNYRPLNGRPLFCHVIDSLFASGRVDQVVIDTDSETIRSIARREFPRAIVLDRPRHLRDGHTSMNDVLLHAVTQIPGDIYLQTHSTNPLLKPATIAKAVDQFARRSNEIDSMFGVTRMQQRLWDAFSRPVNHTPTLLQRTQDLSPVFSENSCLYLFTAQSLEMYRSRIGGRPAMFEIDRMEAWDIDEEADFTVAEMLHAGIARTRAAA